MKKVVVNSCYGGFSVSHEAAKLMADMGNERAKKEIADYAKELADFEFYKANGKLPEGHKQYSTGMFDIAIKYGSLPSFHGFGYSEGLDGGYERDSKELIAAVEQLGEAANGSCANLTIREIPDDVQWQIEEYDGREWISEAHRTW